MAAPVAVTFLGGLGEIGRNCAVIETAGRRVLLDCGRMFAGDDLPGVDSVLPDFKWLLASGGVEACVATHAHEDHIGALPYLLERLSFPVYGSAFTLGLVRHKLAEAGLLDRAELREVRDGDRFSVGPFECEAMPVTHSVPGGFITAFSTPQGLILHSSDFKLDLTPVDGRRTALSRIGSLAGDPGVRLLLADSTNADAPGSSRSERDVGDVLHDTIARQEGRRVIVGAFASHIHRIQQVMDAAVAAGAHCGHAGPVDAAQRGPGPRAGADAGARSRPARHHRPRGARSGAGADRVHRVPGRAPGRAHPDGGGLQQVGGHRRPATR